MFLQKALAELEDASNGENSERNEILSVKSILLTLHALFPTSFVPALDVLDRRLITRHDLRLDEGTSNAALDSEDPSDPTHEASAAYMREIIDLSSVYYVRSGSKSLQLKGRASNQPTSASPPKYEVRTTAWNCTCAAFAFAAFKSPQSQSKPEAPNGDLGTNESGLDVESSQLQWGGLMRRIVCDKLPICKHLLACVLVEHWNVAQGLIEHRVVGEDEWAGWAAGWE